MTQGPVSFQSEGARHFGVSRARVLQHWALLALPATVIAAVDQVCIAPAGRRFFTEKRLRPLSTLRDAEQIEQRFDRMVRDYESCVEKSTAAAPTAGNSDVGLSPDVVGTSRIAVRTGE